MVVHIPQVENQHGSTVQTVNSALSLDCSYNFSKYFKQCPYIVILIGAIVTVFIMYE